MKNTQKTVRDLLDRRNRHNICVIGDQKGREKEKDAEDIYEVATVKDFPQVMKDFKPNLKKKHNKLKEKNTTRHITVLKSQT